MSYELVEKEYYEQDLIGEECFCCLGNLKITKILEKERIARAMKIRDRLRKICEGILADFVNERR